MRAELVIRIDPGLSGADAWHVDRLEPGNGWERGRPGQAATVQCFQFPEFGAGEFLLTVSQKERPDHFEKVELLIRLAPVLRAEGEAFWYENSDRRSGIIDAYATDLHGTVGVDQPGLPVSGGPRVIAYDLTGSREGVPVEFHGTILLKDTDLQRRE